MWLTALAVQYRDIKLAQNFLTGSLIYISPVIYPVNLIPEQYRLLYALNPMVGVIEGFRAALFGTKPMPWELLSIGAVAAVLLFLTGAAYFLRTERVFADVA
jgi:lipopolysaccharide transport system permease protein